jgi:hypothetical protein
VGAAQRQAQSEVSFVRRSGRYPRTGVGDVNTYALFAEHFDRIVSPSGLLACVVPTGIATDDATKMFFRSVVESARLASVFGFENEEHLFPGVDHRVRFCLLTIAGAERAPIAPRFIFYARRIEELGDPERCFTLSAQDLLQVNPNTGTCPIFRTRRDAALNAAIYARVPVLIRETGEIAMSPWEVSFLRMLDMANSSGAFIPQEIFSEIDATLVGNRQVLAGEVALPLYEAKMVHHYDHRFGTYEGQTAAQAKQGKLPEFTPADHVDPNRMVQPYFWVRESIVEKRLAGVSDRRWLLGWRDICKSTDSRTFISAVIPRVAVGHKYLLLFPGFGPVHALVALLSSFAFDYLCRQKHGGSSLAYFIVKQLPVLPPSRFSDPTPWSPGERLADWIRPRVLELIYTAWDLEGFGHDHRWWGPPFVWDDARRTTLLVELDAAMFHLYGFSRDDIEWVMESFPVIKRDDVKEHGDYRTLIRIRETWDAMAAAAQTGEPWVSSLNPPPASPDCAHDPATRPGAPKHAELALARLLDADGRRAHGPPPDAGLVPRSAPAYGRRCVRGGAARRPRPGAPRHLDSPAGPSGVREGPPRGRSAHRGDHARRAGEHCAVDGGCPCGDARAAANGGRCGRGAALLGGAPRPSRRALHRRVAIRRALDQPRARHWCQWSRTISARRRSRTGRCSTRPASRGRGGSRRCMTTPSREGSTWTR